MADRIDPNTERVQVVEEKIDRLAASMDEQFHAVDEALLEQREYTEFAFSRLDAKVDTGFSRLDAKMDGGFSRLDAKMDGGFSRLDAKVDAGLSRLETKMDAGFERVDGRMERIERKLDQFIDAQLQTNALVERRLNER